MNSLSCRLCEKEYAQQDLKFFRCNNCNKTKFFICSLCVDDLVMNGGFKCGNCKVISYIQHHYNAKFWSDVFWNESVYNQYKASLIHSPIFSNQNNQISPQQEIFIQQKNSLEYDDDKNYRHIVEHKIFKIPQYSSQQFNQQISKQMPQQFQLQAENGFFFQNNNELNQNPPLTINQQILQFTSQAQSPSQRNNLNNIHQFQRKSQSPNTFSEEQIVNHNQQQNPFLPISSQQGEFQQKSQFQQSQQNMFITPKKIPQFEQSQRFQAEQQQQGHDFGFLQNKIQNTNLNTSEDFGLCNFTFDQSQPKSPKKMYTEIHMSKQQDRMSPQFQIQKPFEYIYGKETQNSPQFKMPIQPIPGKFDAQNGQTFQSITQMNKKSFFQTNTHFS